MNWPIFLHWITNTYFSPTVKTILARLQTVNMKTKTFLPKKIRKYATQF